MHNLTIKQMSEKLHAGEITSVQLTQHYLNRISQFDADLNAYVTVTPELAIEMAKAADEKLAAGEGELLTGIPVAHKDIFCTDGVKTSCSSKMLDNFIAPYDAHVVTQLNKGGMPILGKTN
ncbi:MAG TPA: Asp-tRNA(Asn)/Glu-tRNA(Gln) amidotransferase GatCAB subunit A, partial [Thiomicrospira sp.]|nr:Asp-tRNA(Asn)/Glu-tRNA(Gln) amidotransferase GatCAB subunit A [Thiomicrospira sp.]